MPIKERQAPAVLKALNPSPCVLCPQPERVLQALKRYMAAEQKDRRHTLRHYQHIEAVDPQKAEQMKFQVRCFCTHCAC